MRLILIPMILLIIGTLGISIIHLYLMHVRARRIIKLTVAAYISTHFKYNPNGLFNNKMIVSTIECMLDSHLTKSQREMLDTCIDEEFDYYSKLSSKKEKDQKEEGLEEEEAMN